MGYTLGSYDVAVIGAGHAGVEAAMAAARLGASTILFTLTLDGIANLPCNPSIGGTAKGHLVREVDALGGVMGIAADRTTIPSRMLNLGKGPAVHSLRAQIDRRAYHTYVKQLLEQQENLRIKQDEVVGIRTENGRITGVVTRLGAEYAVKAAIIASGTYLNGTIHVGEVSYSSGPDGIAPATGLTADLAIHGITLRRFKTGTPSRVHRRSIDFSQLKEQKGDEPVVPFSFETKIPPENKVCCHIAYTNEETHRIILENLDKSPIYSGRIHAIGPRYCPSIEDKIVRFSDKSRHQLFVEPMGMDTQEMYLQGLSSSLPEDVQIAFLRTIKGFEHLEIMRNAYGQFNGTSGYEEAAAQGLIAGINAVRQVQGKSPVTLPRSSSYIGTLINDLVTKGCTDPYRMMTSRSEFRLLLRQDNADERLTPLGHEIGLISEERYRRFLEKMEQIRTEKARVSKVNVPPSPELNELLVSRGTTEVSTGIKLDELIRRPQLAYAELASFDPDRPSLPAAVGEQVEIQLKYDGYIKKQLLEVEEQKRLESRKLPADQDYAEISGLRLEAREKLNRVKPADVGQAARISGVNPADISTLLIWLEQNGGTRHDR